MGLRRGHRWWVAVAVTATAATASACGGTTAGGSGGAASGAAGGTANGAGGGPANFSSNELFPAHLGDSWEYKIHGAAGTQTLDTKFNVSGESAIAGGKAVTFHTVVTIPSSSTPITRDLQYQFLDDGTVKFDYGSLLSSSSGGSATGSATTAVIPSAQDIMAGTSKPFSNSATITEPNSTSIQVAVSGTAQGAGLESVSELGRSLNAQKVTIHLNETETIGSGSPIHLTFTLTMWLVKGIGIVKESLSNATSTVGVVDLVATNLSG